MNDFNKWFTTNLKVSRYPTPQECLEMNADIIINVSDEYIHGCMTEALKGNKLYYWFPMNECTNDMGINSIFGALQILWNAEKKNKKVYLHCHAGVNRSPIIAQCFYYLKTNEYLEDDSKRMTIKLNIEAGHLPAQLRFEQFLKDCRETFERDETMRGGYLDQSKSKNKIN